MIDFATAKPREIEAYLRNVILKSHGNKVEDASTIKASHGSFHISLEIDKDTYDFSFRRKSVKKIVKVIRALSGD